MLRLEASRNKVKAITDRIKVVLDLIDPQLPEPDRPPQLDVIMERCKLALENFKYYACGIACSAVGHALAVVRSVYSSVKIE